MRVPLGWVFGRWRDQTIPCVGHTIQPKYLLPLLWLFILLKWTLFYILWFTKPSKYIHMFTTHYCWMTPPLTWVMGTPLLSALGIAILPIGALKDAMDNWFLSALLDHFYLRWLWLAHLLKFSLFLYFDNILLLLSKFILNFI